MTPRPLIAALLLIGALSPARAQSPPEHARAVITQADHVREADVALPTVVPANTAEWEGEHGEDCGCASCTKKAHFFGDLGQGLRDGCFGLFRTSHSHGRHVGRGQPLVGTSWMNRPFGVSGFVGPIQGSPLIDGFVDQDADVLYGFRFGADLDLYWGGEARFAWTQPQLSDNRLTPNPRRVDQFYGDFSVLYYPWGDSRWRPYALLGLGVANFHFEDHQGSYYNKTLIGMPFGAGIKYQYHPNFVLRSEVLDNLAFGDEVLDTMNNVAVTISMEYRFGGRRRSYFPWHPSRFIE
jgi:opacity protein-like surface antigen